MAALTKLEILQNKFNAISNELTTRRDELVGVEDELRIYGDNEERKQRQDDINKKINNLRRKMQKIASQQVKGRLKIFNGLPNAFAVKGPGGRTAASANTSSYLKDLENMNRYNFTAVAISALLTEILFIFRTVLSLQYFESQALYNQAIAKKVAYIKGDSTVYRLDENGQIDGSQLPMSQKELDGLTRNELLILLAKNGLYPQPTLIGSLIKEVDKYMQEMVSSVPLDKEIIDAYAEYKDSRKQHELDKVNPADYALMQQQRPKIRPGKGN